jgi:RNA polymerase sigma-70 factor (ECF subfamily)
MEERTLYEQDVALAAGVRGGAAAAEAAIYEKYAARVYYLALRELRSPADAEDVRAETFLRVFQAIREDRVREPQALASFILGSAYNVCREWRRRQSRLEQLAEHSREEQNSKPAPLLLDQDVKDAIERALRRLKPREQEFLRLYYYDELPPAEIARRLGLKEERLRLIKSRALKSFREIYERLAKPGKIS